MRVWSRSWVRKEREGEREYRGVFKYMSSGSWVRREEERERGGRMLREERKQEPGLRVRKEKVGGK